MVESELIVRYFSFITLFLNAIALIFYLLPYMGFIMFNFTAAIMFLVAFGFDIGLININFKYANRKDPDVGRWIKNMAWLYLLVMFFGVLLIGISMVGYAISETPILMAGIQIPLLLILGANLLGFLAILGFGSLTALYNILKASKYNALITKF
ncbi:MAG: hypothetical protein GF329_06845 [Candidatus Lokiarchaeota archaeon]|nr:hypothetical protein [Candidatus Lokiarchaeota archaeon]